MVSAPGDSGNRCRIRSMSARSPASAIKADAPLSGVLNSPGLADDRDLDLARVFELVFDPARDVLGQPDRFFVRDTLALDQNPDFAAGLQCEGLRDALEGV